MIVTTIWSVHCVDGRCGWCIIVKCKKKFLGFMPSSISTVWVAKVWVLLLQFVGSNKWCHPTLDVSPSALHGGITLTPILVVTLLWDPVNPDMKYSYTWCISSIHHNNNNSNCYCYYYYEFIIIVIVIYVYVIGFVDMLLSVYSYWMLFGYTTYLTNVDSHLLFIILFYFSSCVHIGIDYYSNVSHSGILLSSIFLVCS